MEIRKKQRFLPFLFIQMALVLTSCVSIEEKTEKYDNGEVKEQYSYYKDDSGEELKEGDWTMRSSSKMISLSIRMGFVFLMRWCGIKSLT